MSRIEEEDIKRHEIAENEEVTASNVTPFKDFLAGGIGGMAQLFVGHPLDTLKITLISNDKLKGIGDSFKFILEKEGMRGLYKGVASPLFGFTALNAVLFSAYGTSARWISPAGPDTLQIKQVFACGAFAGAVASMVECPVDLIKTKMQTQMAMASSNIVKSNAASTTANNTVTLYKNTFDCAKQLLGNHGIKSIYQGLFATLVRNTIGYSAYFGVYNMIKRKMKVKGEELSFWQLLFAGGIGGTMFWAAYPLDAIKSNMQSDHTVTKHRKYKNYIDCAIKVTKEKGIKNGLFRGFLPCILRAFPANGACLCFYELSLRFLA